MGFFVVMPVNKRYVSVFLKNLCNVQQEFFPALFVTVSAKAGEAGQIFTWGRPKHLDSPQIYLFKVIELRRKAFEVKHCIVLSYGNLRRLNYFLFASCENSSCKQDSRRGFAHTLLAISPSLFKGRKSCFVKLTQQSFDT